MKVKPKRKSAFLEKTGYIDENAGKIAHIAGVVKIVENKVSFLLYFVADRKLSSEDSKALQNQEERGII